jgi:plastocyanin
MRPKRLLIGGLALALALLAIMLMAQTARAVNQPITIANFSFSPAALQINVGDSVTWTNSDGFAHTVTSDGGVWDSGPVASGSTFQRTFAEPGIFRYHCEIHPSMQGQIRVGSQVFLPFTAN